MLISLFHTFTRIKSYLIFIAFKCNDLWLTAACGVYRRPIALCTCWQYRIIKLLSLIPKIPGSSCRIFGLTKGAGCSASEHVRDVINSCAQTLYALRIWESCEPTACAKFAEIVFVDSRKKKKAHPPPPPLPGIVRVTYILKILGVTFTNSLSVAEHVHTVKGSRIPNMWLFRPPSLQVTWFSAGTVIYPWRWRDQGHIIIIKYNIIKQQI